MKKLLLTLLLLPTLMIGQTVTYDTLIKNQAYKSFFSIKYSEPVMVAYTLYHGGGECNRKTMHFYNDIKTLTTANDKEYAASGYDKGHMADAEDFASNCKLEELTFRYYNCVPQTPELNRGQWKHYETVIRNASQNDSLFVVCYNEFSDKKMGDTYIPDKCYKFVINLKNQTVMYAFYFTNTSTPEFHDLMKEIDKYEYIIKEALLAK